ncbi:MAG: nuclear transport factor 2 family protein [Rubrobacter sp.]|nr:nuclear transport factor 2 family protein [Rubrobacter sp.]
MDRGFAGTAPEVRAVAQWHEALNGGDVDRLVDLSHPDVEVSGPRGAGRGAQLLRDWANRAGVRLVPRRVFHASETVAVEQDASWTSTETGETTLIQTVASVFIVREGLIASVVRHDSLSEALSVAGLDESDATENS